MIDRVCLITGNEGKAREYASLLGIEVTPVKEDLVEIQALDVVTVVERKVTDAYAKLRSPVLVDDTGLVLDAWNGLPGALIAWWLDAVGPQGILDMAAGVTDRSATVTTALGYGQAGFGYDSIFAPAAGGRTFAEMTSAEKNEVSHRRLAVDALRREFGVSSS